MKSNSYNWKTEGESEQNLTSVEYRKVGSSQAGANKMGYNPYLPYDSYTTNVSNNNNSNSNSNITHHASLLAPPTHSRPSQADQQGDLGEPHGVQSGQAIQL